MALNQEMPIRHKIICGAKRSEYFPCPQNWLGQPGLSANFDDTAPNAVSSRLSGNKRPGKFFVFPLMTNAVFAR